MFVASWRPLLNQKQCLCLSTARWKHDVWKRGYKFHAQSQVCYRTKAALPHAVNVVVVLLFCNGWLHAEWFVDVISWDAGWLCCRQQAPSYYPFITFYLLHVNKSTQRFNTHSTATSRTLSDIGLLSPWMNGSRCWLLPSLTCRLLSAALQCDSVMSANKSAHTHSLAFHFSTVTFFTDLLHPPQHFHAASLVLPPA